MSRLAGLARNSNSVSQSSENSQSTPSNAATPTPSLATLASGARPRQSLSSLAAVAGGGGNTGSGSPSLSSLGARKETNNATGTPSLLDLARGSSLSTTTGTGGGLSRSPGGLTRLASSSATATAPTGAASPGSVPSLTQLAAASQNGSTARRSLTSLATSSTSRSTPLSPATPAAAIGLNRPSVGLTPRTGAGSGSGLSGLGGGLQKNSGQSLKSLEETGSPSLSKLASSSSQPRRSLSSLTGLSKTRTETSGTQAPITEATEAATNTQSLSLEAQQSSTTIETSSSKQQPSLPSTIRTPSSSLSPPPLELATESTLADSADDAHAYASLNYQGGQGPEEYTITSTTTNSLIATPSHFAVSIFEKLDPIPSPIAVSTNFVIQSNPGALFTSLWGSSSSSTTTSSLSLPSPLLVSGAVTPARVFKFDTPSPDDIVFKAQSQGMRSAVLAGRS
ncbi:hypothetical protein BGX21_004406 [Mortierella sp. AD011]|nr:hypothetical protein BGX20_004846 [Mortierella sp. AD010]KAF9373524.1 hypothetical protein BGX21_004406 [Mortierella sp. AD011]